MASFTPPQTSQENNLNQKMDSLDISISHDHHQQSQQSQQQEHNELPSRQPVLEHRPNSGSSNSSKRPDYFPEPDMNQRESNYGGESTISSLDPAKEFIPQENLLQEGQHGVRATDRRGHTTDNFHPNSQQQSAAMSYRQHVYDQPAAAHHYPSRHGQHAGQGNDHGPGPISEEYRYYPDYSAQEYGNNQQAKKAIRQYLPQNSPYDYSQASKYGSDSGAHRQPRQQQQQQPQQPHYPAHHPYSQSHHNPQHQHQHQHHHQQSRQQPYQHQRQHQNHYQQSHTQSQSQSHPPFYNQGRGGGGGGASGGSGGGGGPRHMHLSSGDLPFAHKFPFIYVVNFKRTKDQFIHAVGYGRGFKTGDFVKVEADRGHDVGIISEIVLLPNHFMTEYSTVADVEDELQIPVPQRCVLMHASEREIQVLLAKVRDESKALQVCRQLAQQRQMRLNLLDAEFQFDKNKLTFIFTR